MAMRKKKRATSEPALARPARTSRPIGIDHRRLQEAFEVSELSQFELAKRTNIAPSRISEILAGKRDVTTDLFRRLCFGLRADANYLLKLTDINNAAALLPDRGSPRAAARQDRVKKA